MVRIMGSLQAINVSQETYSRLTRQAQIRGWSLEQFLDHLVQAFAEAGEQAFVERLRKKGMLVSFPPTTENIPQAFKPVPVKGEPVSRTIIDDREPR